MCILVTFLTLRNEHKMEPSFARSFKVLLLKQTDKQIAQSLHDGQYLMLNNWWFSVTEHHAVTALYYSLEPQLFISPVNSKAAASVPTVSPFWAPLATW